MFQITLGEFFVTLTVLFRENVPISGLIYIFVSSPVAFGAQPYGLWHTIICPWAHDGAARGVIPNKSTH